MPHSILAYDILVHFSTFGIIIYIIDYWSAAKVAVEAFGQKSPAVSRVNFMGEVFLGFEAKKNILLDSLLIAYCYIEFLVGYNIF